MQCLALAGASGVHLCGYAQVVAPPTPGAVQDSVQERRAPSLSTPAEVIFPRDVPREPRAEGRRFLVSGFTFKGNTVFPEALLRRIVERHLDLELTLAELDRIADTVTAYYRVQGLTVARAFIPVQRVEDGLVTIQIIEGRVQSVAFKGQKRYPEPFLDRYLAPFEASRAGVIVTDAALERQMLLLNDLPGLKARSTLSPGKDFGTTDMEVTVEEKPISVALNVSNTGRSEIGRTRADASLQLNNPLRLGDQIGLRAIRSSDGLFRYANVGYSIPVGADGVRLAVSATRTEYELGGEFTALGIAGKVQSADVSVSYPYVRTRSRNTILALQLRHTRSEQSALGTLLSKSDLPLAVASVYSNWIGENSSATSLNIALSSNFRKNKENGVADPERVGLKADGEVTYLTGAATNWDVFLRGRGVISTQALPDTEKFSIGGADSVRAYPSAYYRGDKGYFLSAEVRRQLMTSGFPGYATVFADIGGVKTRGFLNTDRLSGVGVGLSYYIGKIGQFKVEYAHPLESSVDRGKERGRAWVSLTVGF